MRKSGVVLNVLTLALAVGLSACMDNAGSTGGGSESLSESDETGGGGTSSGGWAASSNGGSGGGSSSGNWGNAASSGSVAGSSSGGASTSSSSGSSTSGGTVIAFGGSQDFAYFRQTVEAGGIPQPTDMDSPGFFAEHHTSLPSPTCGNTICLQGLVGARENLINGGPCTVIQVGLNSPLNIADLPQLPRRIALVIDESGSMEGRNMEMVKAGLRLMASELNPEDKWALVTFGDELGDVLSWSNYDALEWNHMVDNLAADEGSTNIHAGLMRGLELLTNEGGGIDPAYQNRLILLSDGIANRGVTDVNQIVEEAMVRVREGIGLTTIGVGTAFDPVVMGRLAEASGGTFFFADDQDALEEIFLEEIRAFIVPVGYDVRIEVQAGAHYELRASYGANQFTLDQDRRNGDLVIPAVTLAHRQAHNDNQNGRRGGGSALLVEVMPAFNPEQNMSTVPPELQSNTAIGQARLTYQEANTERTIHEEVINLEYPHGPDVMLPDGYWTNDAIQKNFVMMNLYVGFQLAVTNYWSGQGEQALADLDALMAAATAWNSEIGDEDIADDLRIMQLLRNNIDAEVNEPPAEEPSDPWPQD
ncbi:MAG: VWA domain-containing protein [Myxococcota bacterium]